MTLDLFSSLFLALLSQRRLFAGVLLCFSLRVTRRFCQITVLLCRSASSLSKPPIAPLCPEQPCVVKSNPVECLAEFCPVSLVTCCQWFWFVRLRTVQLSVIDGSPLRPVLCLLFSTPCEMITPLVEIAI